MKKNDLSLINSVVLLLFSFLTLLLALNDYGITTNITYELPNHIKRLINLLSLPKIGLFYIPIIIFMQSLWTILVDEIRKPKKFFYFSTTIILCSIFLLGLLFERGIFIKINTTLLKIFFMLVIGSQIVLLILWYKNPNKAFYSDPFEEINELEEKIKKQKNIEKQRQEKEEERKKNNFMLDIQEQLEEMREEMKRNNNPPSSVNISQNELIENILKNQQKEKKPSFWEIMKMHREERREERELKRQERLALLEEKKLEKQAHLEEIRLAKEAQLEELRLKKEALQKEKEAEKAAQKQKILEEKEALQKEKELKLQQKIAQMEKENLQLQKKADEYSQLQKQLDLANKKQEELETKLSQNKTIIPTLHEAGQNTTTHQNQTMDPATVKPINQNNLQENFNVNNIMQKPQPQQNIQSPSTTGQATSQAQGIQLNVTPTPHIPNIQQNTQGIKPNLKIDAPYQNHSTMSPQAGAIYQKTAKPVSVPKKPDNIINTEFMAIGGLPRLPHKPYTPPTENVLLEHSSGKPPISHAVLTSMGEDLVEGLKSFGINSVLDGFEKGPSVILYKLILSVGTTFSKVSRVADDIARYMGVSASAIRFLPTIPGTQAIGIEIPNTNREMVPFKAMLDDLRASKAKLPFSLGKTMTGSNMIIDITKTPHMIIAGTTGSGKSVCLNTMMASLLYNKSPDDVRVILVDPKVVELKMYNDIPHLLFPVITQPQKAIKALDWCVEEMERRYQLISKISANNIISYNEKITQNNLPHEKMPYILVVIDEFADIISVVGKELEIRVMRIAAKARAIGIHLVLATQRPSADVLSGTLKNNLPTRIAFRVASYVDSKTILDYAGAEQLLGYGDMLYKGSEFPDPVRIQGPYLKDDEIASVAQSTIEKNWKPNYLDESILEEQTIEEDNSSQGGGDDFDFGPRAWSEKDEAILKAAWKLCTMEGMKCSISSIQRRLSIGYNNAARVVEEMDKRGMIGPQSGSKPRELLVPYNENSPNL